MQPRPSHDELIERAKRVLAEASEILRDSQRLSRELGDHRPDPAVARAQGHETGRQGGGLTPCWIGWPGASRRDAAGGMTWGRRPGAGVTGSWGLALVIVAMGLPAWALWRVVR